MDRIDLIIKKRLNQHKLGESAKAADILYKSNVFLQKKLNCSIDEVKAFRLKDGVLYVGTVGSAWSQEVFHQRENLMREVRCCHGQQAVFRLIIKGLTTEAPLV